MQKKEPPWGGSLRGRCLRSGAPGGVLLAGVALRAGGLLLAGLHGLGEVLALFLGGGDLAVALLLLGDGAVGVLLALGVHGGHFRDAGVLVHGHVVRREVGGRLRVAEHTRQDVAVGLGRVPAGARRLAGDLLDLQLGGGQLAIGLGRLACCTVGAGTLGGILQLFLREHRLGRRLVAADERERREERERDGNELLVHGPLLGLNRHMP